MVELIIGLLFILLLTVYFFRDKRNATGVFFIYFSISCILPYFQAYFSTPTYSETFTRFLYMPVTQFAFVVLVFAFLVSYFVSSYFSCFSKSIAVVSFNKDNSSARNFAVLALFFNALYLALSIGVYGGFSGVFESSFKRVQATSSASNIKSIFYWGGAVFSVLSYYLCDKEHQKFLVKYLVFTAVFFSLFLSFMNGGRSVFLLFIFALVYRRILLANKATIVLYSICFIIFSMVISYGMILLRYFMQGASKFSNTSQGESLSIAMTGLRYLDHFVISIMYTESSGHDFGRLYFNALLSFIPRDLWDGKPQLVSASVRNYLYGDFTGGIPPGLFGEGYIAFGVIGVIFISVIYGILLGKLDSLVRVSMLTNCPFRFAFAGIMVPLVGFTLIRGGVDIGVFRLGIPFFWLLVARVLLSFYQIKSVYLVNVNSAKSVGYINRKKLIVL